ncbi:MAG: 4-hydroxy-tetrahydrodipicolinate synthase [Bacteroidales bacterium]|nr:4-hydroxy-tetrahydrodipicolinate synthase [Bacteroidales bacterium]
MMEFKGCGTALVTPFKENGEVDYEAYSRLVRRQAEGGVDFLVALATTAETPTLSVDEKRRILLLTYRNAVRPDGSRLPIIAGCGSNSVEATLANAEVLDKGLFDAYLVVVPFYNKPTQEGMYRYFSAVSEALDKPVILYNVPGRTGANMTAQTCLRIARDCRNVIGVKEASGKLEQMLGILEGAPEGFSLLSGDDDMTEAVMEHGAKGVISVASNVRPDLVSDMTGAALKGDFGKARALDAKLGPLFKACFVESNPIPAKEALHILGLCANRMRLPLTEATEDTSKTISAVLGSL